MLISFLLQIYENALATTVALNPDVILSDIVDKCVENLSDPQVLAITKDDYFTYLTPEGELYDKSVLPG